MQLFLERRPATIIEKKNSQDGAIEIVRGKQQWTEDSEGEVMMSWEERICIE